MYIVKIFVKIIINKFNCIKLVQIEANNNIINNNNSNNS